MTISAPLSQDHRIAPAAEEVVAIFSETCLVPSEVEEAIRRLAAAADIALPRRFVWAKSPASLNLAEIMDEGISTAAHHLMRLLMRDAHAARSRLPSHYALHLAETAKPLVEATACLADLIDREIEAQAGETFTHLRGSPDGLALHRDQSSERQPDDAFAPLAAEAMLARIERVIITETACHILRKPVRATLNSHGRPHAVAEPALVFADGQAIHALDGVWVPSWVIRHPERLSPQAIEQEPRADTKRVMIERFGWAAFLGDEIAEPAKTAERRHLLARLGVALD